MQKYVFITPTIDNMGGAQLYIRNKMLFLMEAGWDVYILTTTPNRNILIPELKPYKDNYWRKLSFNCYEFSKKQVERTIRDIITLINASADTQIIVESTCMEEATWAELLSQRIGAKHLFFSLQELNKTTNLGMRDFLIFKHKRKEIAGINSRSLCKLFENFYPINNSESYHLSASANNVEADVDCPFLEEVIIRKYDAIIGCLSRLDKQFVFEGIEGLIKYCNKFKTKKILLILIGGAPKSYMSLIKKRINEMPNIDVKITGYIYPVPIKLLNICDAFFSSAGSARVCLRSGAPTVSFDANDLKPIGIIGRTTNNSMFRDENEPPIEFVSLLEDIIDNKRFKREKSSYILKVPDYSSHLEFISQSETINAYFDILSITLSSRKEKLRSFILKLFGPVFYTNLGKLKQ